MNVLLYLIPIALLLGFAGLAAFIWAMRNNQFDDLDGAAYRILREDTPPTADAQINHTNETADNPPR